MKKIILFILTAFIFMGCDDELEYNIPSFQANKNGNLWQAVTYSAIVDDSGMLRITGYDNLDRITLLFVSVELTTHHVATSGSWASLIDANNVFWSTNNTPDTSVQIYPANGALELSEFNIEEGYVSGSFSFNAFNSSGLSSVNYNEGFFYKIPLTITGAPAYYTCEEAEQAVQIAQEVYNNVDVTDAVAYEAACIAYREALVNQMLYCGDANGQIQSIIDMLDENNCMLSCEQVQENSQTALINYNNATMSNYIELCNTYATLLNDEINSCGDSDGSIQASIDALDCGDDDNDGIANIYEDANNDGDYTNDDSDGDLNPNYLDDDDDDDLISSADELVFDDDGNPLDVDNDGIPDYLDNDDDNDGVPTQNETGDTDEDGIPDYLDSDDDGDGILTIYENPSQDTDGDGTPDYLDSDDDGDSILTIYEDADPNGDNNPSDAFNFDSDVLPNYLDNDDDDDGILTIDEDPDPNGDGNPNDATNSDADTAPDYLDAS